MSFESHTTQHERSPRYGHRVVERLSASPMAVRPLSDNHAELKLGSGEHLTLPLEVNVDGQPSDVLATFSVGNMRKFPQYEYGGVIDVAGALNDAERTLALVKGSDGRRMIDVTVDEMNNGVCNVSTLDTKDQGRITNIADGVRDVCIKVQVGDDPYAVNPMIALEFGNDNNLFVALHDPSQISYGVACQRV
jgi:hypothetical protein